MMKYTKVERDAVSHRFPVQRAQRETYDIPEALLNAIAETAGTADAIKIEDADTGSGQPLDRVSVRSWQVKLRSLLERRGLSLNMRYDSASNVVYAWATAVPH